MTNRKIEYVLGENITGLARASRSRSGSAVLSVRLSGEELTQIETIAQEEGKTLSQVVREALRKYANAASRRVGSGQLHVTVTTPDFTFSSGREPQISQPGPFSETRTLVPARD